MDDSMQIQAELYFKKFSVDEILKQLNSHPIKKYEDELIEGSIIDIGCGQSAFLLDFIQTDRKIIAIDKEQLQLDYLKSRVKNQKGAKLENWTFQLSNFPVDKLPDEEYSLIIMSNILHFFTLEKCIEIGKIVEEHSQKGTMIYTAVHSLKHYVNDLENPEKNAFFKHFFSVEDLEKIFPLDKFDKIYCAEIENISSKSSKAFTEEWIDEVAKVAKARGATTCPIKIEETKKAYDKPNSQVICIFRKK